MSSGLQVTLRSLALRSRPYLRNGFLNLARCSLSHLLGASREIHGPTRGCYRASSQTLRCSGLLSDTLLWSILIPSNTLLRAGSLPEWIASVEDSVPTCDRSLLLRLATRQRSWIVDERIDASCGCRFQW